MARNIEGMGWRVSVSILTFFGLIGFIVVWLFLYADYYTIYQNLAVLLVSFIIFIGLNAATWAPWGMKQHEYRCEWEAGEKPKPERKPRRKAKKR